MWNVLGKIFSHPPSSPDSSDETKPSTSKKSPSLEELDSESESEWVVVGEFEKEKKKFMKEVVRSLKRKGEFKNIDFNEDFKRIFSLESEKFDFKPQNFNSQEFRDFFSSEIVGNFFNEEQLLNLENFFDDSLHLYSGLDRTNDGAKFFSLLNVHLNKIQSCRVLLRDLWLNSSKGVSDFKRFFMDIMNMEEFLITQEKSIFSLRSAFKEEVKKWPGPAIKSGYFSCHADLQSLDEEEKDLLQERMAELMARRESFFDYELKNHPWIKNPSEILNAADKIQSKFVEIENKRIFLAQDKMDNIVNSLKNGEKFKDIDFQEKLEEIFFIEHGKFDSEEFKYNVVRKFFKGDAYFKFGAFFHNSFRLHSILSQTDTKKEFFSLLDGQLNEIQSCRLLLRNIWLEFSLEEESDLKDFVINLMRVEEFLNAQEKSIFDLRSEFKEKVKTWSDVPIKSGYFSCYPDLLSLDKEEKDLLQQRMTELTARRERFFDFEPKNHPWIKDRSEILNKADEIQNKSLEIRKKRMSITQKRN